MNAQQKSARELRREDFSHVWGTLLSPFRSRTRRGEGAVLDVVCAVGAALFAGTALLFGVHPLGLALLCAVCGHAAAVLVGLAAGCLFQGSAGGVYFALYLAVFFLRMLFSWPRPRRYLPQSPMLFGEVVQLRVMTAALAGFALGLYELFAGSFATYTLLFALGAVLLPPLFTFAFCGAFAEGFNLHDFLFEPGLQKVRGRKTELWAQLGVLTLLFSVTFSLAPFNWFGISPARLFAGAVALVAARRFGALPGAAAGFIAALPAGAVFAPAFGFAGFFAGLLRKKGMFLPMACAVAAGRAWCAYLGGVEGFLSNMPELAVATLLIWPLTVRIPAREKSEEQPLPALPPALPPTSAERLAKALRSLSQLLRQQKPLYETERFQDICKQTCSDCCRKCPARKDCWETAKPPAVPALEELCRSGALQEESFAFCTTGELLPQLTAALGREEERSRLAKGQSTAATDFDMIAQLLGESAAHDRAEAAQDPILETELRGALKELGVQCGNVAVTGERRRRVQVSGLRWDGQKLPAAKLHETFEQLCGCALSDGGLEMAGGAVTSSMETVRRFAVRMATSAAPAAAETESGDRTISFENREDYFYALLCDGMGSGEEASSTAGLCIGILTEMLCAGNNQETSLRMLNNLIRSKAEECSATVDLLEIDLLYGRASFVKSGAAASYVKRGDNLFRIHSETSPVGILRSLDAERINFSVRAGDVIILLSDGISQSMEDAPWLLDFLSGAKTEPLQECADQILALARAHGGRDDMTVLLAAVSQEKSIARQAQPISA